MRGQNTRKPAMPHLASLPHRLMLAFRPWSDVWVRSGWRVQVHCATGQARILDPAGRAAHAGTQADCLDRVERHAPPSGRRKAAILLHGLLNHPGIMNRLAVALQAEGWAVANLAYPSTRLSLPEHAVIASRAARVLAEDGAGEISLIGHSLGGLIARAALSRAAQDGWHPGRLVLIGSPTGGSATARTLRLLPGYEKLLGQCGMFLTSPSAPQSPAAGAVAVIAGGTGARGFNPLLPGDNDFTVTVAETQLPGAENLLVRAVHNALPERPEVVRATLRFLKLNALAG